ncbi:MAG: hypothetical protein Kow00127_12940 [Bacteroidales bacterium]
MGKSDSDKKVELVVKDTPGRSLAKAVSWRIVASLTTFLLTFVIFKNRLSAAYQEILETSIIVMVFDVIFKIVIYYFHERLWTNIRWGKYIERNYWRRRAWRKMYRKMHKS